MADDEDDPGDRYRERAAEVRARAENATTPNTREMLLDLAASYEDLADRVSKGRKPTPSQASG